MGGSKIIATIVVHANVLQKANDAVSNVKLSIVSRVMIPATPESTHELKRSVCGARSVFRNVGTAATRSATTDTTIATAASPVMAQPANAARAIAPQT